MADADKTLHRVSIGCQPDCTVVVDNKVMPFPESANATVYLEPGPHAVVATWSNNRHRNSDVNAVPGGNSKLVFNAASADKAADAPSGSQNPSTGGTETGRPIEARTTTKRAGFRPWFFILERLQRRWSVA